MRNTPKIDGLVFASFPFMTIQGPRRRCLAWAYVLKKVSEARKADAEERPSHTSLILPHLDGVNAQTTDQLYATENALVAADVARAPGACGVVRIRPKSAHEHAGLAAPGSSGSDATLRWADRMDPGLEVD
jgi:hypothetical protein